MQNFRRFYINWIGSGIGICCILHLMVTADTKLRARREEFISMLVESKHGLIRGNIKDQGVFPYPGIREENRKVDLGYYHARGDNQKVKLIEAS